MPPALLKCATARQWLILPFDVDAAVLQRDSGILPPDELSEMMNSRLDPSWVERVDTQLPAGLPEGASGAVSEEDFDEFLSDPVPFLAKIWHESAKTKAAKTAAILKGGRPEGLEPETDGSSAVGDGPVQHWFKLAGLGNNMALVEAASEFDVLARNREAGLEASVHVSDIIVRAGTGTIQSALHAVDLLTVPPRHAGESLASMAGPEHPTSRSQLLMACFGADALQPACSVGQLAAGTGAASVDVDVGSEQIGTLVALYTCAWARCVGESLSVGALLDSEELLPASLLTGLAELVAVSGRSSPSSGSGDGTASGASSAQLVASQAIADMPASAAQALLTMLEEAFIRLELRRVPAAIRLAIDCKGAS